MKTLVLSALALGVMTGAALAKPAELTDSQLDQINAGLDQIKAGSAGTIDQFVQTAVVPFIQSFPGSPIRIQVLQTINQLFPPTPIRLPLQLTKAASWEATSRAAQAATLLCGRPNG